MGSKWAKRRMAAGRKFFVDSHKQNFKASIPLGGRKYPAIFKVDASNRILRNTVKIQTARGYVKPAKEQVPEILVGLKNLGFGSRER